MAEDDLTESVLESAAGPRDIDIDGNRISEHSLPDQIAAAKFAASNRARRRRGMGVTFQKIVPHGAVLDPRDL
jgi:hypothetical protein